MKYKEPLAIRPFGAIVDKDKIIDPFKFKKPEPSEIIAKDESLETEAIVKAVDSNIKAFQEQPTRPSKGLSANTGSEARTIIPEKPVAQKPLHSGRNAYVIKKS